MHFTEECCDEWIKINSVLTFNKFFFMKQSIQYLIYDLRLLDGYMLYGLDSTRSIQNNLNTFSFIKFFEKFPIAYI